MDRSEQVDLPEQLVEQERLVYLVPLGLLDFLEQLVNQGSLETLEIRVSKDFRDYLETLGHQALRETAEEWALLGHREREATQVRMESKVLQEEMEHRDQQVWSYNNCLY